VTRVLNATYGDTLIDEVVLAFLPLGFLATLPFASRIRRQGEASRRAGATTASTLEEGLSNVLAVQSLGGDARQRARFDRDSSSSFREFRRLVVLIVLAIFVGSVVGTPLVLWIARLGTDLVIAGQLSTGDFALLITYFIQAGTYSVILGTLWLRVQNAASGLQRVFALMDLPGEEDAPGAPALPPLRRELRLLDVHFSYEDGTQALDGVDVTMPIGEVTALVGPAGAGKTTLAWLVPRFLRPTRGRVLFDGVDVAGASLASVRSQVAFVFQETQLFDATVEENLRIGRPDASDAELRRAAEIAGAEAFIRALPQGWRTRLGRAGGALSVGQKQRLAIARALVRDAPVLILDEPTSALDPETERRLVAALREASRSRVVLVIAHRLSTIRAADQILFLDAGRVIERGTHDELMSRPAGAYRRYVELQTRGAA
jgi:ABC-type multidrug transport system fused ATPase/permease subunit